MFILRMISGAVRPGLVVAALVATAAVAKAGESAANPFVVVSRTIIQDQGDWRVDWQIRLGGSSGRVLTGDEITARVEGWVSNSRAPGHGVPRWSSLTISGPSGRQASADLIESDDEDRRCRERGVLRLWAGEGGTPANGRQAVEEPQATLSLAPGATFRVRLRLEHRHVVYGDYDPLLGTRTVELWLGSALIREALPLDREQFLARPPRVALEPPDDRRDSRYYTSAPDSLHLEAHVPGNQSLRFPEIPVRYGTRMRLRFRYLVASGTEGCCLARVAQYKDTPTAWKVLSRGPVRGAAAHGRELDPGRPDHPDRARRHHARPRLPDPRFRDRRGLDRRRQPGTRRRPPHRPLNPAREDAGNTRDGSAGIGPVEMADPFRACSAFGSDPLTDFDRLPGRAGLAAGRS